MKIKPLGDKVAVLLLEQTGMIGLLHMPEKMKSQGTLTRQKALVLAVGPKAKERGLESGMIVLAHEAWGEEFDVGGKKYRVGKARDIEVIFEGEALVDKGKYLD